MIHRKKISAIACLLFVFSLMPWKDSTADQSFFQPMIDADQVPWTDLSYRAKNFMVAVNTHVNLSSLSGNEWQASLLASPRSIPVQPSGSKVYLLTLNTKIDPFFRSAIRILNQVWFDPKRASALGRIRLRRGKDDFKKSYRFTQHGVFRIRRGPQSKKQALLPTEQWTDVKDTFYSYEISKLGCPSVSERLILIYLLSAADLSNKTEPISLCVFGKRQLHHVQLRPEGLHPLEVDYIERRLQSETRRKSTVEALKIAVLNQPLDSDLEETENFSFLGLHNDIEIWIDSKSRIPIQVSGVIPNIGKVALKLSEVKLRAGTF